MSRKVNATGAIRNKERKIPTDSSASSSYGTSSSSSSTYMLFIFCCVCGQR